MPVFSVRLAVDVEEFVVRFEHEWREAWAAYDAADEKEHTCPECGDSPAGVRYTGPAFVRYCAGGHEWSHRGAPEPDIVGRMRRLLRQMVKET